ncbi:hypothetical protein [Olivibacter oleidegradans]|uniref:Restriction endonuclease n=1 Tax=Olivibacter oleidegradans TaxID=760123 RepID=A0ABV6HPE8_9SPHI
MNYANHNLRTNLQEWKSRLYKASYQQFGQQLKHLFNNIDNSPQLFGVISEIISKFPYTDGELEEKGNQRRGNRNSFFDSEAEQASFSYQLVKYYFKSLNNYNLHNYTIPAIYGRDFEATKDNIVEDFISPILNHLHDRLDKSSATIFLLEKYKKRTEWFTRQELNKAYKSANNNYEQIFEDNLRLFLFDQGIDYPFSTPLSSSGRADIVGEIETDDPLIVEIKIFDREKHYGKDRIKKGFSQIVKYANDYHKDAGYLVIFNMENVELNFKFGDNKNFPTAFVFNGKTFYFIVINCDREESASKIGTLKEVTITAEELTNDI